MITKIIFFLLSITIILCFITYKQYPLAYEISSPKTDQNDITLTVILSRIREIQDRLSSPSISKGERDVLEKELEILKGFVSNHLNKSIKKTD